MKTIQITSLIFMFDWLFGNKESCKTVRFCAVTKGQRQYDSMKSIYGTLSSKTPSVEVPDGINRNDWIASNCIAFYNEAELIYSSISDQCTDQTCPHMTAGPHFQYLWQDDKQYQKPTDLSAPQYITLLLEWANEELETYAHCSEYSTDFMDHIKKVMRRLFRLYAHLYVIHKTALITFGGSDLLNVSIRHFIDFAKSYDLVPEKELQALEPLFID